MSNTVIRKRWTPESSAVKVWTEKDANDDEQSYVRVPVSSTSEDRDGDNFTDRGLKSMQSQYKSGDVGMFLDHGDEGLNEARYPTKGIIGKWEGAEMEGGKLYGVARLNKANEDSEWLRDYLKQDMPVGFSVGFRALDYDGDMDEGFKFHDVDLLETSAVGIPSNPDGVAGMSAEDSEWRNALQKDINMSNDDNQDDLHDLVKELRDEVNELKAQDSDETEETKDTDEEPLTKSDLLEILEAKEDSEDSDDEDDEEDEEEDEDDDGKDTDVEHEKGQTFVITAESEEQVKALNKAREESESDDGTISLGESKTVVISEAEESEEESEKDAGGSGWRI